MVVWLAVDEDRARCLAAGMGGFISKPVEFAKVAHCLAKWTGEAMPRAPNGRTNW
jgi:CheY-like chemotaxis protein